MSNQVLSWAMFAVPWLTVLLLPRELVKRYMPVALFSLLTSIVIYEMGITFHWWAVTETVYPLHLQPFQLGMLPVLTIWIFRFTFGKFWWFLALELVVNTVFAYGFLGWFMQSRGILHFEMMSRIVAVGITTAHGLLLYGYQLWQEGILKPRES